MLFQRKKNKNVEKLTYDPEKQRPILKCSICNGEKVAGIKDLKSGHFEEVMLIRTDYDLEQFRAMVGTEDILREY